MWTIEKAGGGGGGEGERRAGSGRERGGTPGSRSLFRSSSLTASLELARRTSLKLFCSFSRKYIFKKLGARLKFVCSEFSTILAQIWGECSYIM